MYVFVCVYMSFMRFHQLIYYTTHHFIKGIHMLHFFPSDKLLFFYTLIDGDLKVTHMNLIIQSSEIKKDGEQWGPH
jgi:hypothetical protein